MVNVPLRRSLPIAALVALGTGLTAAYLYAPLGGATLGMIDDHEILRFLGPDRSLSPTEIPGLLISSTEVGQWGEVSRFRPVYYALRMLEASVFGDAAPAWYVARIIATVLIALTFAALALAAVRTWTTTRAGRVAAAAFCGFVALSVVTLPSLPDMIMRLGPSEVYVGIGLAILATGAALAWRSSSSVVGWVLLPLGLIIAVGSKEDVVILVVPFIALYVLRFASMGRRPLVLALGAVAVAFAAFVGLGVVLGSAHSGGDIYGQERTIRDAVLLVPGNVFATIAAAALVVALVTRRRVPSAGAGRGARLSATLVANPALLLTLLGLYAIVGELYFYQHNATPTGFEPGRYGFLTVLATILSVSAATWSAVPRMPHGRLTRAALVFGLVVLVVVSPFGRQYLNAARGYRDAAAATAAGTQAFRASLDDGLRALAREPDQQVLIVVQRPFDYERVYSLPQFLAFYGGVETPVFVRVDAATKVGLPPYEAGLVRGLDEASKEGNLDQGWRISPISQWDGDRATSCFVFAPLEAEAEVDDCDEVHVIAG